MRKQQTIKFPLSKASQLKVRADYKKNNGLARNSTLESVYRSLGIFNEKQASNVMAEMYNNRIEKDNQNVDVKRQEKKISIKSSKNLYDNLSSNTLFENENKKQHSNKIIKKFLNKKAILKRYQMTPTESTHSSYEKYIIPSYDQGIITKMIATSRRIGSEDNTIYVEMTTNDVRSYAKQVSNYCYNMFQNAIKKFGNARVYAVVNFKCHSTKSDGDDYGSTEFSFARNLGRIDIYNFQDFQKYFINGTINVFNSINGKDYVICYGFNSIELNVVKHNPFHGSSYTELPACVKNSKSVINIKNTDQKCFLYSILSSRHEIASHPERVSHYEKFMSELQWKETDFPMAINKVPYFEKKNNI